MAKADNEGPRAWSPTFVRNRAEVITIAVLIFAFTMHAPGLTGVPFVPLAGPIPRSPVLALLLISFAYFVIVWCLRAWIEFRDEEKLKDIQREMTAASKHIESTLEIAHQQMASFELKAMPRGWIEDLDKRIVLDPRSVRSILGYSQMLSDRYREQFTMVGGGTFNPKNPPGADKYLEFATREIADWHAVVEAQGAEWQQEKLEHEAYIRAAIDKGKAEIDKAADEAKATIAAYGPRLSAALAGVHEVYEASTKTLKSYRHAVGADKVVLGYYVPLIFALSLVLLSLPQAIADTREGRAFILSCVGNIDFNCLYRSEPTKQ